MHEGAGNLDIAVTADSQFLYSLNSGNETIGVFAINQEGKTLLNLSEDPVISSRQKPGLTALPCSNLDPQRELRIGPQLTFSPHFWVCKTSG